MATVTVRMFATVREAAGASSAEVDAKDLDELLQRLGEIFGARLSRLLAEAASDPDRMVLLLNGKNITHSRPRPLRLADGDEVAIFPPVSGG